jgi:hypothetical protein
MTRILFFLICENAPLEKQQSDATSLKERRDHLGDVLQIVGGAPVGRRKRDVPEIGSRGFKFDGRVKTFGHRLRAANHLAGDTLFGSGVFQHKARLERQALFQNQQSSIVTNAHSSRVEGNGLTLQRHMDIGAHTQEDALAATAFVARDPCRLRRGRGLRVRERLGGREGLGSACGRTGRIRGRLGCHWRSCGRS